MTLANTNTMENTCIRKKVDCKRLKYPHPFIFLGAASSPPPLPASTDAIRSETWTACRTPIRIRYKSPAIPTTSQRHYWRRSRHCRTDWRRRLGCYCPTWILKRWKIVVFSRKSIIIGIVGQKFLELRNGGGITFKVELPDA